MARIKFLDVLEETKRKPSLNYEDRPEFSERAPRFENRDRYEAPASFREQRSEGPAREERSPLRESRTPASFAPRRASERIEKEEHNTKIIWLASLFVFLGGVLFLGGYWLGQALKREMPIDRMAVESAMTPILPPDTMPAAEPMRTEAAKPIPVIKPITASPVKKAAAAKAVPLKAKSTAIGKGEYVVQVSAHTNIEAARANERKLIDKGIENVYISENYMGDNQKIFRVRVRNGFKSETEAKKALPEIRSAVGLSDTDGRIIKLN